MTKNIPRFQENETAEWYENNTFAIKIALSLSSVKIKSNDPRITELGNRHFLFFFTLLHFQYISSWIMFQSIDINLFYQFITTFAPNIIFLTRKIDLLRVRIILTSTVYYTRYYVWNIFTIRSIYTQPHAWKIRLKSTKA